MGRDPWRAVNKFMLGGLKDKRLLIVEDNSDDERLTMRAVERLKIDHQVDVVHDGREALHALGLDGLEEEPNQAVPDLIICDLKLPKVKGDELLDRVRADRRYRDLPFIMFSSSDEWGDIDRCMSRGATAYVVKPIDYKQFMDRISEILNEHLLGPMKSRVTPGTLATLV